MSNTRQRIITFLNKRGSSSAIELSHTLSRTPANIRHHLTILEREGVVEIVGERVRPSRGRPTLIYKLAHQARLHNLDNLSAVLMSELIENSAIEKRDGILKRLAEQLIGYEQDTASSLVERLNITIQKLNGMHYLAHWEAGSDAPRITFRHCPYTSILEKHPEICRLDVHLLETIIKCHVEQIAKLELDSQGLPFCCFIVTNPMDVK
jgi:predicted ArsR family transcriptional regulator